MESLSDSAVEQVGQQLRRALDVAAGGAACPHARMRALGGARFQWASFALLPCPSGESQLRIRAVRTGMPDMALPAAVRPSWAADQPRPSRLAVELARARLRRETAESAMIDAAQQAVPRIAAAVPAMLRRSGRDGCGASSGGDSSAGSCAAAEREGSKAVYAAVRCAGKWGAQVAALQAARRDEAEAIVRLTRERATATEVAAEYDVAAGA